MSDVPEEQENAIPRAQSHKVALKNLYLDPNNYRFIDHSDYVKVSPSQVLERDIQRRTMKLLLGNRQENIRDLVDSFKRNGWLPVDQIQVRKVSNGRYMVVEGNRRVATLKHLEDRYKNDGIELGNLDSRLFDQVPVVFYEDSDETHHLVLMGLKHISGNKKWAPINQAELMRTLQQNHGMSPDDICKAIGISKRELNLSIRTLHLCEQYQKSDYGDQFESDRFNLFREVLKSPPIRTWIQWNDDTGEAENKARLGRLFSWMSQEDSSDDGETENAAPSDPPVATGQQVRELARIINDAQALDFLDQNRSLSDAQNTSSVLVKNRIQDAIEACERQITSLFRMSRDIGVQDIGQISGLAEKLNLITLLKMRGSRPDTLGLRRLLEPFNQVIHAHFSRVEIKHFRRLDGLVLENFRRVNLIAGINNAGKTSILESLQLLAAQHDPGALLDSMKRRSRMEGNPPPEWLAEQLPRPIELRGIFDGRETRLTIDFSNDQNEIADQGRYLGSLELQAQYNHIAQSSSVHLFKEREPLLQLNGEHMLCRALFASPFSANASDVLAQCHRRNVERKGLDTVLDFVREHVDPNIRTIDMVAPFDRFMVNHRAHDRALDLAHFGDGLQRVFTIASMFASVEHGILLIDEVDAGVHTRLLPHFLNLLLILARQYNVQLFITSHSKECIDAFLLLPGAIEDLAAYGLIQSDAECTVRRFTGGTLQRLVELMDFDLRIAQ